MSWALTLLGTGLDKAGRVISAFVLARVLSDEDFGTFLLLLVTLNTVGMMISAGLQAAAVHFISSALAKGREELSRNFWGLALISLAIAGCIVAAGLLGGMEWMAERVFAAPETAPLLRLGVPVAALLVVSYCAEGILQGLRHFGFVAASKAVSMPLTIAATAGLGIAFGLRGAVVGLVGGGLLLSAMLSALTSRAARRVKVGLVAPSPGRVWAMARMSAMLALATVTTGLTMWLGQVILTRNSGLAAVGMFGVGNQLRNLIALVPATLSASTLPFLSARYASGDREGFRMVGTEFVLVLFAVVGPICILMSGLSREVLTVCYGAGKAEAWPGANLLFWAQMLLLPGLAMRCVVVTLGEPVLSVLVNMVWALVYLIAAWFLTARFGYEGLAAATLLGSLAVTPLSVAYLIRRRAVDLGAVLKCFAVLVCCAAVAETLARAAAPSSVRWALSPLAGGAALLYIWHRGFSDSARRRIRGQLAVVLRRGG